MRLLPERMTVNRMRGSSTGTAGRTRACARAVLARIAMVAAACSALAIGPAAARAQSIMIQPQPFGGRDAPVLLSGTTGYPISGQECTSNVGIPLQLTNVPYSMTQMRFLSVWRGTPTSAACQTSTNRRSTGTTAPPCTFVTSYEITSTIMSIELPAMTAFGTCGTATTQEFWFLAVPAAMDNTTDLPSADGLTYGSLQIGLDPTPPGAPTGLEPSAGDTQIGLAWDNPSGVESLSGANVYVDPAGCDASGNPIAGGALSAGGAPPSGITPITVDGTAVRSATIDGSSIGLEYGEYAAVAVSIVDRAHNESNLSNVVCVQRVQVRGFWDAYCAERGMDVSTCTATYGCSAIPGAPGGRGALGAVGLVIAAALAAARRRRSR